MYFINSTKESKLLDFYGNKITLKRHIFNVKRKILELMFLSFVKLDRHKKGSVS